MPTHTQHAMNIIIVVLLAIVMVSVDQSYFGAPNCGNSIDRQTISPCWASCTIIGGGPETINLQFVCKVMCRNVMEKDATHQ